MASNSFARLSLSDLRSIFGRLFGRRRLCFHMIATILFSLVLAGGVNAQDQSCAECDADVKVGFYASVCSGRMRPITVTLNDVVLNGTGDCTASSWATSPVVHTRLKIDKTYLLTVGTDACSTHINFTEIPDEYVLEIDGVDIRTIDKAGETKGSGDGTWNIRLRRKCPCEEDKAGESAGATIPPLGGVTWEVGSGQLTDGRSSGQMSIREKMLSASVYTPASLVYSPPGLTNEVDVVRGGDGSVRQVKSPQTLADVVTTSSSEYEVRFYRAADVGAKASGLYPVSGQPNIVWRIKNPNPPSTNRLQILKVQNGITDTDEYTWDSVSGSWTLNKGNGASIQNRTVTYPSSTTRTETTITKDAGGIIAAKVARTFQTFPWGEEVIKEVVAPDLAALTTTYKFYENPAEANRYGRAESVTNPDGSWEKYDYDGYGNLALVMRPWKDLALGLATEANSRSTRYTYSNTDGVLVSLYPKHVSSMEEKVTGTTVKKTTYTRTATTINGEPARIESRADYSSLSQSLTTTTTTYHSSASIFLANRIASVVLPDGRQDNSSYEKGNYTTNADPSLNQFTPEANGTAQRDTIIHGTSVSPAGLAFKTTKETMVRDQYGNTVMQETYVYNGTDYERVAWTVMDYDDRGHLIQVRRHNGQVSTATWEGDRRVSETDESGVETTFTYDALVRVRTRTKKGIAAAGGFASQPDIVTTLNYDAAGRVVSESIAASGLTLASSSTYDIAGRIKTQTDQAGLTTNYAYSNGGRTQTVTLPGGPNRISDRFLDGRTKSGSGTAVVTRTFDYAVNADGTELVQEFVGSAGLSSPRWSKTTGDWLDRQIKVESPGFSGINLIRTSIYNNKGQLQTQTITAGANKLIADKLYEYDELGKPIRVGADVDGNGSLVTSSADRISEAESLYEKSGTDWFYVTTNKTYLSDSIGAATVVQTQKARLNNFTVD